MSNYAILFADIVGSSALYKHVGDDAARKLVADCLTGIAVIIEEYKGRVVKTIGDEIMCFFCESESAVRCAQKIQQNLHLQGKKDINALQVKVGIHYGHALIHENDIFGDAVNTASRMSPIAKAEQIITTQETVESLPEDLQAQARLFDTIKIKGFSHDSELYIIEWVDDDDYSDATVLSTGCNSGPEGSLDSIYLKWGDHRIQINSNRSAFVIGRDPEQCDLSVTSRRASRKHIWIEFRRGKFVLIDHSSNGTWVQTQDGKPVYLRREELPLMGSGLISLGVPVDDNVDDCIRFVTKD